MYIRSYKISLASSAYVSTRITHTPSTNFQGSVSPGSNGEVIFRPVEDPYRLRWCAWRRQTRTPRGVFL